MSSRLRGTTALLTAAGQGIGRATALAFAEEGAVVWATDINQSALKTLVNESPQIRTRILDARDAPAIQALVEEIGQIDVLFNCAGYVHHGTILDCTEEEWNLSIDLNLKSMYYSCRAVLPVMLASGHGSIINMSSGASSVKGAPNRFVYGTTKAGVIGLTKSIAIDFIRRGIRCNAICPGTVDSPSLEQRMRAQGDFAAARSEFIARQPMGRLGKPEEIAAFAVYLASDESAFTTGQIHVIDGGWTL
ncbi:MAG TPA: SDR family oxidoreductase [Bryobacteraceae bacterium]|nr:SDR family oxidoreductase [Bryobacteraceae bacterium]